MKVIERKNILPFVLVTSLFALWGLANNMTDTLLAAFKRIMDMSDTQTSFIQMAFYGAYFCIALPAAMFIRNHSTGRGGAIPALGEIRNCHINVGTGKELTICALSELIVKAVGFEGTVEFDANKPDGTMRKLIDVSKLHSLGWTHKVEIEDGVRKLFEWYKESIS